jgi:rod shape-determining protein MreD
VINALVLAVGFALLVAQGMLEHVLVSQWLYPSLILPLVLYMAVGQFSVARGASLSFVLGYLTDAFSGLPMGLFTFSMVAVFLLARVAGLKLFLHGVVFQVMLVFVGSIAVGVLIMGLHLIFERTNLAVRPAMLLTLSQAAATAILSPLVFALVRRLPGAETPKPEES